MHRLIFFLLILILQTLAQDSLSGNIGGMIFEPAKGPFIVKSDITVPEGTETIIKAGCVFLFHPFAGIIVNGSFSVEGVPDSSVVFTSFSDEKYSKDTKDTAKPFDWNGIFIAPKAGDVRFSDIKLTYSVFGIKSQKDEIIVKNALFKANGQFHITIKDKIQEVTDGVPFNYEKKTEEPLKNNNPPAEKRGFNKALPLIGGATGLVMGAAAVVSFIIVNNTGEDYKNEVDPDKQKELKRRHTSFQTAGIVLTGVSAICLSTSAVLYVKNKNQIKKSISIYVSPTCEPEIGMIIHF
jgi:hypothetical protein